MMFSRDMEMIIRLMRRLALMSAALFWLAFLAGLILTDKLDSSAILIDAFQN